MDRTKLVFHVEHPALHFSPNLKTGLSLRLHEVLQLDGVELNKLQGHTRADGTSFA